MIQIAIVDDDQLDVNKIEKLLSENIDEEYKISKFLTAESFIEIMEHKSFDIIFLDIILGKKDGIQVGKIINQKYPQANIIFVSANPAYFKDVYKVTHSYFLTKEFEKERFSDAVKRAVLQIKKEYILIHTKNGKQKVCLNDIVFLESNLRHTILYFNNGTVTECNINLKDIEKNLPCQKFVRTHKSFIVNMNYIEKYDRQKVYVSLNCAVPISRNYLDNSREKIACYFGGVL